MAVGTCSSRVADIWGQWVRGRSWLLAGLVGAYVGAINQGAVPTIATAWQVGAAGRVC